jgi:Uma2 family endonuclease
MSAVESIATPEGLLRMTDGARYELVAGQLVEKNVSQESSWIAGELLRLLANYCDITRAGWAFPADAGYQCFAEDANRVRKPDVSFVRSELIERYGMPAGFAPYPPDLAAEVVSRNDNFEDLSEKINEYLAAGIRLVWIIDPISRKVSVYHPDGRGVILSAEDELDGEGVVPGFRCKVGDLFRRLDGLPSSS